jgi:vitamin B12 transporter
LTDRIWLRAAAGYSVYDNIDSSRLIGAEGTVRWTVPGRWLNLSANGTWFNSRDTSGETPVPLPSDPWFFLNGQATFTQTQLVTKADSAHLDWNVNYVHGFPLSTGERGREETRLRVAAQTVHTAALRYVVEGDTSTMSAAVEVNNVTNAEVMDFFGVQRPGRAFFLKLTYQARSAQ